ncbi:MAG: acyltransferase [Arthrobacter sp.]|nr:acyltransferase [Arthrobacter sp.]
MSTTGCICSNGCFRLRLWCSWPSSARPSSGCPRPGGRRSSPKAGPPSATGKNWSLAASAVDYAAADHSAASPLQHYWSQSIQGQVFILWPLIFAAGALIAKKTATSYRLVLAYAFGAVFAFSLICSIYETSTNQALAYFDTRARLWEFALGSLLAIVLPMVKYSSATRVIMGWAGVAGMISCGVLLQVQQQFPGFVALWPTLSACMIITAGDSGSRYGLDRILASRPLTFLGGNSYALYLWHWPLLVIFLNVSGRETAGPVAGAGIIAVSLLLAILSTRYVEKPIRTWEWASTGIWRPTIVLISSGYDVIYQGSFFDGSFHGRSDFLIRDADGNWIVHDTKLARSAKGSALMQLAAYAGQLAAAGVPVHEGPSDPRRRLHEQTPAGGARGRVRRHQGPARGAARRPPCGRRPGRVRRPARERLPEDRVPGLPRRDGGHR